MIARIEILMDMTALAVLVDDVIVFDGKVLALKRIIKLYIATPPCPRAARNSMRTVLNVSFWLKADSLAESNDEPRTGMKVPEPGICSI